jgi:hypothetical protein
MPRLRPLSEAECYTRLYGDREATVSVIRDERAPRSRRDATPPNGGPLGEHLRREFERRLDARADDLPGAAAA